MTHAHATPGIYALKIAPKSALAFSDKDLSPRSLALALRPTRLWTARIPLSFSFSASTSELTQQGATRDPCYMGLSKSVVSIIPQDPSQLVHLLALALKQVNLAPTTASSGGHSPLIPASFPALGRITSTNTALLWIMVPHHHHHHLQNTLRIHRGPWLQCTTLLLLLLLLFYHMHCGSKAWRTTLLP
jgi:hypothetical protein